MFERPKIRLLIDAPTSGTRNMAVDEYLLQSATDEADCTLRFYAWSAPTLSLGYFQHAAARAQHLASSDCPLVRRASGGGAILHHHEITYSFVQPITDRVSATSTDVYDTFHESLIEALGSWGVDARLANHEDVKAHGADNFLCFRRRAIGDVVIGGTKIAGSAQRRSKCGLLQHGSVLLKSSACAPELPGIADLAGVDLTALQLIQRWRLAVKSRLNADFYESVTTPSELQQIEQIELNKFASPQWTNRR